MKVLITGANGQLGSDVVRVFQKHGNDVLGVGRELLDVRDIDQVKHVLHEFLPDAVIHCAAYTAVDQAETDEDAAFTVNAIGTRNLAVAAEEIGAKLCYISTDYVFDGTEATSYKEYDSTNPLGVYGKSKRAGELLVQALSRKFFIVRTSWVYGKYGNNFVKTMLKLAADRASLQVVNDQVGSPTYTVDLAYFLLELIYTEKYGIYHASNTGTCSWYEFAKAIFTEAEVDIKVDPCTTEEFPRPAPRPKHSVMDHMAIRTNGFRDLRHWREALRAYLQEVKGE